jgi:hypothetical protein
MCLCRRLGALALVALVVVASGCPRVASSRGRSGRLPALACSGRQTGRRAADAGAPPRGRRWAKPKPPPVTAFPRCQSTAPGVIPMPLYTSPLSLAFPCAFWHFGHRPPDGGGR